MRNVDDKLKIFVTNTDFLIPISLQPSVVDLKIFQSMNCVKLKNQSLKYLGFTPPGCKNPGIHIHCLLLIQAIVI